MRCMTTKKETANKAAKLGITVSDYLYLLKSLRREPTKRDVVANLKKNKPQQPTQPKEQKKTGFVGGVYPEDLADPFFYSEHDVPDIWDYAYSPKELKGLEAAATKLPSYLNETPQKLDYFYDLNKSILVKFDTKETTIEVIKESPRIEIPLKTAIVMQSMVDKVSKEVGWLCSIEKNLGVYRILNVFVPQQEVHGTTCEIKEAGISALYTQLIKDKRERDYNNLRAWIHSHVCMPCSPSSQDKDDFKEMYSNETINDFFIMGIINKSHKAYFEFVDIASGLKYKNVDFSVVFEPFTQEELDKDIAYLDQQLATNVKLLQGSSLVITPHGKTTYNKKANEKAALTDFTGNSPLPSYI